MNGGTITFHFEGDTTKFKTSNKKVQDGLDESKNKMQDLSSEAKKMGDSINSGINKALKGIVAIGTVVGGIGVNYNAQMQSYTKALETLTGSAEEADKIMEQIKKDAVSTPFDVKGLVEGERLLISTGLSAEQARKDILNLGDAISASGGGNEELSRMAVNLQQIKNVGKATALDIKQFAYAGIDIYGLLADSMGVTKQEATEMEVSYEMLSQALAKASSEGGKYYGAMESQSKTFNGALSNLEESVQVLAGTLTEKLTDTLTDLMPKISSLMDTLSQKIESGEFDKLASTLGTIAGVILTLITAFKMYSATVAVVKAVTMAWAVVQGILNGVLLLNPIGLIVAGIVLLIGIIALLWIKCEWFRNGITAIFEFIKTAVQVLVDVIVAIVGTIIDKIKWYINLVISFWTGLFNILKTAFEIYVNAVKTYINKIKTVITSIWNFAKKVVDWIKQVPSKILNAFKTLPSKIGSVGKSIMTGLWNGISGLKNWVVNKVKNLGKSILNSLKNVLGIHSPSTEFAMVGKFSVLGFTEQLDKMKKQIQSQVQDTFALSPSLTGSMNNTLSPNIVVNNNVSMETDPLGQTVSKIKTFSGGAKNDYNYGMGV